MSYGISAYAVSLENVENAVGQSKAKAGWLGKFFGSPNANLLQTLKRELKGRFEQEAELDDEEPSFEQALTDLVVGNRLHPSFGHKYAYALEVICDHFGERLDNSAWSGMHFEWTEKFDNAMKQAGIDEKALSLHRHLMFRESPIPIPTPGDFPSIGYLRKSEMDAAIKAIDSADLSVFDEEANESIMQIREWLERCQMHNCDLVCFYY